jgi:hypothetical protein
MRRRDFLRATSAGAFLAALPEALLAQTSTGQTASGSWDPGTVHHLLPTVSDTQILLKASFDAPLPQAPVLRVGRSAVPGRMTDTRGETWAFHATALEPGRRYTLSLTGAGGRPLCAPWELGTFPAPDARPERLRVLFFTCAGGHQELDYLPTAVRNRLLRRALSFQPDAAVANGDHVYWDLRSPLTAKNSGASAKAQEIMRGTFSRSDAVLGSENETILKRAAGPQITPVYGTDFRSTPVFFVQDDHDYFDNDDAYDEIVTFPPDAFMTEMARATQAMYYPEFLPDATRPAGLPGSSSGGRALPVSESFGTLRYGRLAEVLLYTVRRTMTMAGPSAVFLDREVEAWLTRRMTGSDATHVVNAPSNPPGWSAGKWGEWYPDVLGADGKLTTSVTKPYWQPGWLKQHDRLLAAMSGMRGRVPLSMSGDLHAVGVARILRSGVLDVSANPVVTALTGPVGTGRRGWPSDVRKVGPTPPVGLTVQEQVKPIEQNGFTLADFTADRIVLRFFKWDARTQSPEAIDALEPFHTEQLPRPA